MSELVDKPQEPKEPEKPQAAGTNRQADGPSSERKDLLPDMDTGVRDAAGEATPAESADGPTAGRQDPADSDAEGEVAEMVFDGVGEITEQTYESYIGPGTGQGLGRAIGDALSWTWTGRELILPAIKEKLHDAAQATGESLSQLGEAAAESMGRVSDPVSPEQPLKSEMDVQLAHIQGEAEQHTHQL